MGEQDVHTLLPTAANVPEEHTTHVSTLLTSLFSCPYGHEIYVGARVGVAVGALDGASVGAPVGVAVGALDGGDVGFTIFCFFEVRATHFLLFH